MPHFYLLGIEKSCWREKGDGDSAARFQRQGERRDGTVAVIVAASGVGAAAGDLMQSAAAAEAL